ncbi:unnamed protein product, partial [Chrysoparadoxa australica]
MPPQTWHCHCCGLLNRFSPFSSREDCCRVCGRPHSWRQQQHKPFFGTSVIPMRPQQAQELLTQFDANETDVELWTPLALACKAGNIGVVKELLAAGALLDAQTKKGWRPLHFACLGGSLEVVKHLLDAGAQVMCCTKVNKETPLHIAARSSSPKVLEVLLKHGAPVNLLDVMHRTPLHHAAVAGALEQGSVLLAHGADIKVFDIDGFLPQQAAEFAGHQDFVEMLEASQVKVGKRVDAGKVASWHTEVFWNACKEGAKARERLQVQKLQDARYAAGTQMYKDAAAEAYATA